MSRHEACELFRVIRYVPTAGHGVEWVFMGAVHDASAVLSRGAAGSFTAPARGLGDQDVAARAKCGRGRGRHAGCELFWAT